MTPSINVIHPQLSPSQVALLLQQMRVEGRRQKKFKKKRELNFPTPSQGKKYTEAVYAHLCSVGLRTLNLDAATPPRKLTLAELRDWAPREERLAQHLWDHALRHGSEFITSPQEPGSHVGGESRSRITADELEQACDAAATFAVSHWQSDFLTKLSEAGRKGGRISKRGPQYTPDMLDGLDHLSIRQQAIKLGCTDATISRLRKKRAKQTSLK